MKSPNPYNTRKLPGLPPTPIANPGLASMQAAAHPAKVDYLFFVRKPDKVHHFFTQQPSEFHDYADATASGDHRHDATRSAARSPRTGFAVAGMQNVGFRRARARLGVRRL